MEFMFTIFLIPTILTCFLFYQNATNLSFGLDGWSEIVLGYAKTQNEVTWNSAQKEFRLGIEALKTEFPHQSLNTWLKIQATIINTLQQKDPIHPAVITILVSPNCSTRFAQSFTIKLAYELNKSVYPILVQGKPKAFDLLGRPKEIDPNTFQKHSITFIRNDIERYFKNHGKALIVHNITNFKKEEDLMIFHGICDNYHSVDVRATILFPVRIPTNVYENMEPSLASTTKLILTKAWSKILDEDSVPALVTRVADTVILLENEDECKEYRVYEIEDSYNPETNYTFSIPLFPTSSRNNLSCINDLPFYFTRNKRNIAVPNIQAVLNSTFIHNNFNSDEKQGYNKNRTGTNDSSFDYTNTTQKHPETKKVKNTLCHPKENSVKTELKLTNTSQLATDKKENINHVITPKKSEQEQAKVHNSSPPKQNNAQDVNRQPVKPSQDSEPTIEKNQELSSKLTSSDTHARDKKLTVRSSQSTKQTEPHNKHIGKPMKNKNSKGNTLGKNHNKVQREERFSKNYAKKYDKKTANYEASKKPSKKSSNDQKSRNSSKSDKKSNNHNIKANKNRSKNKS